MDQINTTHNFLDKRLKSYCTDNTYKMYESMEVKKFISISDDSA